MPRLSTKSPTAGPVAEHGSNVLLIAYHYPPCSGSSGLLRTLKFSRYLPDFGWKPVVLTVRPRAYESCDERSGATIPETVPVIRAFALDTKKHLGWRGRYLDWLALPDRWITWLLGATLSGLRAVRKYQITVIFSTFPIPTAILAGFVLHRLTGKPWVVDFRDSMTEENYPGDARMRRVHRWIEQKAVKHAVQIIFTSPSARRLYVDRYPGLQGKCLVIPNGFDEEDFTILKTARPDPIPKDRPLRLLHTGLVYREERDPRPFFRALARLKQEGRISSGNLQIIFRACGSEDYYQKIIESLGISDLIQLKEHVPYQQSLQECADADGLLLFQAGNCDHQIPAKAYEYLRLGKPILALTTHTGDTAELLKEIGGATIVNLGEEDDIYRFLPAFLDALRQGTHSSPDGIRIQRYARRNQAEELARCLSLLERHGTVEMAAKVNSFADKTGG